MEGHEVFTNTNREISHLANKFVLDGKTNSMYAPLSWWLSLPEEGVPTSFLL